MAQTFLEKLKSKVIAGAQNSAVKIEEAARTGKLHLDIMAERRKLIRAYSELGKEAHLALLEDGIEHFRIRPGISELQADIERCKKEIDALEKRLAEVKLQSQKPG